MNRLGVVAVGLGVALALGCLHSGTAQSQPAPPPATVYQGCSVLFPGTAVVTFAWPPTPGALQQWVDLSLFDNGFQPGTFLGKQALNARTLTWIGITPELPHFYRVNVLYPDGWVTVASGSFVSIGGCPKPTAISGELTDIWCNADSVDVTFRWTPANGDSQWLDLAESPEAMALGMHHAQGPLSPDTSSYRLRIPISTSYWWRVNTHSTAGWSSSMVWSFTSSDCTPEGLVGVPPTPMPPAAPPTPVPPPAPPLLPVLPLPPTDTSDLEWVYVYHEDYGDLIIIRPNGQVWLIEYGVGCISMWRYEGKRILIYSPGIFAGIGSKIILPDDGQDCRIWYSEYLG